MEFTITNQEQYNNRPLLDVEFKAKWVAALRSGKYKQGHLKLNKNDHFCCLGVACEIGGLEKEKSMYASVKGSYFYYGLPNKVQSNNELPEGFLPEISRLGRFNGFSIDNYYELTTLNDSEKYSFNQIADVIETHF